MKLIQKQFLKGTRELEVVDDVVNVHIKKLLKEEKLTIGLSTLDPEAVINGPYLEFHSRVTSEPLLSLLINEPSADEFNAFVDALKQGISGEDKPQVGVETASPETSRLKAPGWNVYEEPPEFEEADKMRAETLFQPVSAERLADDITMLSTYLDQDTIKPLIDALETLRAEPQNEAAFQKVVGAYKELGINQGAVLTYAPYLKVLLSKYTLS